MSKKRVFYESWLKDYDYSAWLEKHASKHKVHARYVQRILNWETLGLSSLSQVEQSTKGNSRQESVISFSIIPLLLSFTSAEVKILDFDQVLF